MPKGKKKQKEQRAISESKIEDVKKNIRSLFDEIIDYIRNNEAEVFQEFKEKTEKIISPNNYFFTSSLVINPVGETLDNLLSTNYNPLIAYYYSYRVEENQTRLIAELLEGIGLDKINAYLSPLSFFRRVGSKITDLTETDKIEMVFEEEWKIFSQYINQDQIDHSTIFPIKSLEMIIPKLELSPQIKICKISEEKRYVWNIMYELEEYSSYIELKQKSQYSINFEGTKNIQNKRYEQVNNVISILNLYCQSLVQISSKILLEEPPIQYIDLSLPTTRLHSNDIPSETKTAFFPFLNPELTLTKEKAEEFKNFYSKFENVITHDTKLALIMQRLQYLFSRRYIFDIILDLSILFEIIMNLDKELQFRLAMNTASLIGQDKTKKDDIYDDMLKFYRLRSKIIHGADFEDYLRTLGDREFVNKIFDYFRKTLFSYIDIRANDKNFNGTIKAKYF